MAVKHRATRRVALRLPLDVSHEGRYLGCFETRDIDADGAFVKTGGRRLPENAVLELAFRAPERSGGISRMKAVVAYSTRDGVGVWFTLWDSADSFGRLNDMIGRSQQEHSR